MKKRQLRKIFKIVARQINRGDFTPLKPVHFWAIDRARLGFFHRKYVTEFRPWWYSDSVIWKDLDLVEEIKNHSKIWNKEFQEWSGIDSDLYTEYFQKNHKKSS